MTFKPGKAFLVRLDKLAPSTASLVPSLLSIADSNDCVIVTMDVSASSLDCTERKHRTACAIERK